jgi:hypothetical protein
MLVLRQKSYLFHKNCYFYKRTLHLQYYVNEIPPNIKNYLYHVPYFLLPICVYQRLHPDHIITKDFQQTNTPSTLQQQISYGNTTSSPIMTSSNTASLQIDITSPTNNTNKEIDYIPIENWTPLPPDYNLPKKFLPYIPQNHCPLIVEKLIILLVYTNGYNIFTKQLKSKKKKQHENITHNKKIEDLCKWDADIACDHSTGVPFSKKMGYRRSLR